MGAAVGAGVAAGCATPSACGELFADIEVIIFVLDRLWKFRLLHCWISAERQAALAAIQRKFVNRKFR
jgi:hypothetical protein